MSELSKTIPMESVDPPESDGLERAYSPNQRENIRSEAKEFLKDHQLIRLEIGRAANKAVNMLGGAVDTVTYGPAHSFVRWVNKKDNKKVEKQAELVERGAKFKIVQQLREKKLERLTELASISARDLQEIEGKRLKHKNNVEKREDKNVAKTEQLVDRKKSKIGAAEYREFLMSLRDEAYSRKERRAVKRSLTQKQKAEFGNIHILNTNTYKDAQKYIRHDPINEATLRRLRKQNRDIESQVQTKDGMIAELNDDIEEVNKTTQNPLMLKHLADRIAEIEAEKAKLLSQSEKNISTMKKLGEELEIDPDRYEPSDYFSLTQSNSKDKLLREKEAKKRHRRLIGNIALNSLDDKKK